MIVDPDFFEHWRTRMLVDMLGEDEFAPMYVMRIWAHCQSRKAMRFERMPPLGVKALCRYKGDAQKLETSLIASGFIERDGDAICVPKWAEHNAKLIANWENGGKGGRPKKTEEEPNENPKETQIEPIETQQYPIGGEEIRSSSNPKGLDVASGADDLLGDSPAAGKQTCPHQKIIDLYHEVLPMCPRIRDWTPARATQLRARWNEDEKRQCLLYWKTFFEYVKTCDFLVGKAGKTPFFADLEWLTKSGNFTKVREGKYENKQ